ncbi:MAG: glycoside hydrolase family 13 protein [Acidimicrobiia bacterium]|nr:glycoside hydrolase family 13 protein [Acidimicrobiia bacterium]
MARPYFPDGRYFGEEACLFPADLHYDPNDRACCDPQSDGSVLFRLRAEVGFAEAVLVLDDGTGIPMDRWACTARFDFFRGIVPAGRRRFSYTFALRRPDGRAVYLVPAGVGNAVERLDRWALDLDDVAPLAVPDWARGAVIYQIFPERFRNGDPALTPPGADPWGSEPHWLRFQGGDLAGIAEQADYLADLGVDVVYLNPVFASPSTHRYDVADFYSVDPALGGNAALGRLVAALHDRGMRLILDASFNHCHPRFFAFADVLARGLDSPYAGWFALNGERPRVKVRPHLLTPELEPAWGAYLRRVLEGLEAESGVAVEVAGGAGMLVEPTYEAWYGVPTMPRIDLTHPEARRYFLEVGAFWLREYGIDGWRMDVARYVDPGFWPDFRRSCRRANPDCYLLAEIMGDATPWLQGDRFDATMNYTFRDLCASYFAAHGLGTAEFLDGFTRMLAQYAPAVTEANQNLLSSHDTERFLHVAGGDRRRVVPAFLFQLTAPGAPGIYYGDEVGMSGGKEPASRGAFPWHEPGAWDLGLQQMVRSLAGLRRAHPALRRGDWRLRWQGEETFAFSRVLGEEEVVVLVNRGPALARVAVPVAGGNARLLWGEGRARLEGASLVLEEVPAGSGMVVAL